MSLLNAEDVEIMVNKEPKLKEYEDVMKRRLIIESKTMRKVEAMERTVEQAMHDIGRKIEEIAFNGAMVMSRHKEIQTEGEEVEDERRSAIGIVSGEEEIG
jgi:hypothetical protein